MSTAFVSNLVLITGLAFIWESWWRVLKAVEACVAVYELSGGTRVSYLLLLELNLSSPPGLFLPSIISSSFILHLKS